MKIDLIIFDFDGVVVDSELIAIGVLASIAAEYGHAMSAAQAVARFGGSTVPQLVTKLEQLTGRALGRPMGNEIHQRTLRALRQVKPIAGLEEFLNALGQAPICIASTSALDRIHLCLEAVGLGERFGAGVFSVSMVQRNKPAPDIFLHAARTMGAAPERTIVIEDSANGIRAAVAAGMHALGLTAASHLAADHGAELLRCGAAATFATYREIQNYLPVLQSSPRSRVRAT